MIHDGQAAGPRSEDDVRAALEESTEDLRAALEQLEQRARWEADLGRRIGENAWAALLAAFIGGALLGAITARR
jgi:hypothetical protein